MKVLSTAQNIGQAFKNAGRVSEILKVLASHGFADLLVRMKLARFLPSRYAEDPRYKSLPAHERLRLAFEALGPTFIKFGQLLATRADLLAPAYIQEFQKLQDRVGTLPFSTIRSFLESELKGPLESHFEEFKELPMAAASIAQVHSGKLKTGEQVAIKVQRPGIDKIIRNDISILRGLAALLEKYVPESKPLNPTGIVEEFFQTIFWELDFRVELNNIRRIRGNLEKLKRVAVPKVYEKLSTSRILVMERFEGVRFSDREAIVEKNIDPQEIVALGCDAFFHMVMKDGLFHGDLHAGNLFILNDARIGIIDFGIVGHLSRRVKDSVMTIFVALIDEDYETLAYEYAYLSRDLGHCDISQLQKDLMDLISPYIGMSLGEVNIGHILLQSTAVAARNNLRVPRELMLLFKALVTIEGLGKSLDPNFDLLPIGTRLAREAIANRYSKEQLVKDFVLIGREVQGIVENLPRQLKRFLRRWSQNDFVIETANKDIRQLGERIQDFSRTFASSTLFLGFFGLGVTLVALDKGPTVGGVSIAGLITLFFSSIGQVYSLWQLKRKSS